MRTNNTLTRKDHIAVRKTNKWLADNGISLDAIRDATIWQIQAQKAATHLLKNKAELLTDDEHSLLIDFVLTMMNNKNRNKLTNAHTYLVLNTCKKINRDDRYN